MSDLTGEHHLSEVWKGVYDTGPGSQVVRFALRMKVAPDGTVQGAIQEERHSEPIPVTGLLHGSSIRFEKIEATEWQKLYEPLSFDGLVNDDRIFISGTWTNTGTRGEWKADAVVIENGQTVPATPHPNHFANAKQRPQSTYQRLAGIKPVRSERPVIAGISKPKSSTTFARLRMLANQRIGDGEGAGEGLLMPEQSLYVSSVPPSAVNDGAPATAQTICAKCGAERSHSDVCPRCGHAG